METHLPIRQIANVPKVVFELFSDISLWMLGFPRHCVAARPNQLGEVVMIFRTYERRRSYSSDEGMQTDVWPIWGDADAGTLHADGQISL